MIERLFRSRRHAGRFFFWLAVIVAVIGGVAGMLLVCTTCFAVMVAVAIVLGVLSWLVSALWNLTAPSDDRD